MTETTEDAKQFMGILIAGTRYHVKGLTFERGEETGPIDEATKNYLEDECGIEATVDNGDGMQVEYRPRFRFAEVTKAEADSIKRKNASSSPARSRRRPGALAA